jgi:signal transduction histidine kinase/ActR/RegA family two-component response regulator
MFLRRSSKWVAMGVLALAYFVAGKAGLRLAFLQPNASPVWPPAGIAVAALLVLGSRAWPAIFIGAFLVNLTTAGDVGTSLGIASGNTLEALCAAWLLNRYAGGTRVFDRAQDVFKFALIGAGSTAISPSIGVTSLALDGFSDWGNYGRDWVTWWLGDLTGYLVIMPLVLLWWVGPRREWNTKQKLEAGVLLFLLVAVGGAVFGGWLVGFINNFSLTLVCGPIILWTAFRFGQLETVTGIFIIAAIALWGTLNHTGPFQLLTDNESPLTLQSWAGVMMLTSMTLAAAMTERRRIEAELEQQKATVETANRTKDNFLAMLSHELRTPLTPVVSYLDILEAESGKSETLRTALAAIRRNIELEGRLIDDLLDLTRIARGKLKLELKPIDAHEAILHAVDMCQAEAAEKRLSVKLDLSAADSWVEADAAKFPQIIWNLLKNAIKFTPDAGEIRISSANDEPAGLTIAIHDNGIGIEPEVIGRVFNAFEQAGQSLKQHRGGLGLGLAISKAIAIGHGASLRVSSDGRGCGTTFSLTMDTTSPPPATVSRPAEAVGTGKRTLRILLVDDHVDTCAALEKLLARRGHRVVTAHDVRSAIEAARCDTFDLLISDMGLPDGTGVELMARLNGIGAMRGIAISGFGMYGDVEKSLAAGFAVHLIKPVQFQKLEEAIAAAMCAPGRARRQRAEGAED